MLQRPAFYLVIDVEATCSEDESIPRAEKEIIELGAVMVEAISLDAVDEFQSFVRPERHPRLTRYCRELTTIRQIEVDIAPRFPQALAALARWAQGYSQALFCSWGDYDRIQIERDCRYHRVAYPFGRGHLNLKALFATAQRLDRPIGMESALRRAGLSPRGTLHRGIDDARNLARLLPYVVR